MAHGPGVSQAVSALAGAQAGRCGTFLVARAPLNEDNPNWGLTATGPNVLVPMFAYLTVNRPAALAASALELGMRAMLTLSSAPGFQPPHRAILVIAPQVQAVGQDYRFFCGLAVQVA